MVEKSELVGQTELAFDFIHKLYMEVSYLIKEIEGLLYEEEEQFVIGKPSGYGISYRGSAGLDTNNVSLWLLKKFAVFFVAEDKTQMKGGQSTTEITDDLRVMYLRIVLNSNDVQEPTVYSGVLHGIEKKPAIRWITKFEHMMGHFEYNDAKIFKNIGNFEYEDKTIKINGKLIKNNLYEINNSDDIREKIIKPSLELYRQH